jgi:serine/threonine protein kinase
LTTRETARRFHFLREIASGGFGSVFLTKVMHADGFSRLAAVKLLHRRWSENEEIARRMRDEARLLGWLRHRNIVDVVDLTSIDGRAAVIMEFLEAVDLKYIVQDMAERGELVPAKVAIEIMALVASALDAAYNRPPFPGEKPLRVIHRDIKPSNIMLDDVGMVKVLDFGVARADFESRESHTRELQFGSVDYMPPERLFFEPETPASDVYSLAASVYELLVLEKFGKARGRPQKHQAFVAERMAFMRGVLQVTSAQAEEIEQLVSTCLSYEHSERFTAADVYTKARALARRIEGPDLREWAESVIPPLVRAFEGAPREANPLIDQVLNEDSHALDDGGDAVAAAAAAASIAASRRQRWRRGPPQRSALGGPAPGGLGRAEAEPE